MSAIPIPSNENTGGKATNISFSQEAEPFPSGPYEYKLVYLRKAYGIFFIENFIVTLATIAMTYFPKLQSFQQSNPIMPILFITFLVAFPFTTMFCPNQMKIVPNNYLLAICFTVSSSFIVSYIGARTNPSLVLLENQMGTLMLLAMVIYLTVVKNTYSPYVGFSIVGGIALICCLCGFLYGYSFKVLLIDFAIVSTLGVYYVFQISLCINERQFLFEQNEPLYGSFLPYTDLFYFPLKLFRLDKYTRMA